MNGLFKKGLVSLAAASVLATGAMAAGLDGNITSVKMLQESSLSIIPSNKTTDVRLPAVFVDFTSSDDDTNLTTGDYIGIRLNTKGVTFKSVEAAEIKGEEIFGSGLSRTNIKEATITTDANGYSVAYVEIENNVSSDTDYNMTFRDITIDIDPTNSDLSSDKTTIGIRGIAVKGDEYDENTTDVNVAYFFKEANADNLVLLGNDAATIGGKTDQDLTEVPTIKTDDQIKNATDATVEKLIITTSDDTKAGGRIHLTFSSVVSDINESNVTAYVVTDSNESVSVSVDNYYDTSDKKLSLIVDKKLATNSEIVIDLNTSAFVISNGTSGDYVTVTVSSDDNFSINEAGTYKVARMDEYNAQAYVTTLDTNESQEGNESALKIITIGASNWAEISPFIIKENWADTFGPGTDESNFTITLLTEGLSDFNVSEVKIYDDNETATMGTDTNVSNATSINPSVNSVLGFKFNLDANETKIQKAVIQGIYVKANSDASEGILKIKIKDQQANKDGNITKENGEGEFIIEVAKLVKPEASIIQDENATTEANVTASGSNFIAKLSLVETYYGSIQKGSTSDSYVEVYVKSPSDGVTINAEASDTKYTNKSTLNLSDQTQIDTKTVRFDDITESNQTDNWLYGVIDVNLTIDSTVPTDTPIILGVRTAKKDLGTFTVGKVSDTSEVIAKDVNVTEIGKVSLQTLGTIRIKEAIEDGLKDGNLTIIAPDGVSFDTTAINNNDNAKAVGGPSNNYLVIEIGSNTYLDDINLTIKGYVSNPEAGPLTFKVKDGNVITDKGTKANIKSNDNLILSYATSDGNVPTPTLTADKTSVEEGTEQNITLTCEGTGYGTTSIEADSNNPSSITLSGSTVTVSADAVAGDTATFTCKETLGGKTSSDSEEISIEVVEVEEEATAEPTVVDALLETGSYTIKGTFSPYDFEGVESAFDWAYVTSSGSVYQLRGQEPSDNDVFGWKAVDVTVSENSNSWYMINLGDWDNDGVTKFDWVLIKQDGSKVYKLGGVSEAGNFDYEGPLTGIQATINNNTVTFTAE